MDFASSSRAAGNKTGWKRIVEIFWWCSNHQAIIWSRIEQNTAFDIKKSSL